eukprot:gene6887-7134_t
MEGAADPRDVADPCGIDDDDDSGEPPWARRGKPARSRLADPFHFPVARRVLRVEQAAQLQADGGFLTGTTGWDSALVLAKFLEVAYPAAGGGMRGCRVVELGSGTGLVGLACACLGGAVTLTDADSPAALALLRRNAAANAAAAAGLGGSARVV